LATEIIYTYIYLPGETAATPAGKLEIVEDGRDSFATFQYGKRYLQNPDRVPVDAVSLPLPSDSETVYRTEEGFCLFGGIRDAAPDGWGRHLLERESGRLRLSEAEYLLLAGEQRVGALAFGRDLTGPLCRERDLNAATLSLEELFHDAEKFEREEQLPPDHRIFFLRGSSLGGARPKATTSWKDEWWLAKFARQDDRYEIVRSEYATMTLARKCGLNVPPVRMEKALGKDIYLIKRFDRMGSVAEGRSVRQHFHSALTMLAAHESESKNKSYSSIADVIRLRCAVPEQDCRELFRRMLFNIFVNNTDDHLRNHGFLLAGNQWMLSPLYDVVPQVQVGLERDLALGVGRAGRSATLTNALSEAKAFYLNQSEALAEIRKMAAVIAGWRDHFVACGFSAGQAAKFETCFLALGFIAELSTEIK
jgi:serine/threonine-protein kinase HipA